MKHGDGGVGLPNKRARAFHAFARPKDLGRRVAVAFVSLTGVAHAIPPVLAEMVPSEVVAAYFVDRHLQDDRSL